MRIRYNLFALIIICLQAQYTDASLTERRIYYLDCSYSMISPNNIWDEVCDNLIDAINDVDDETTELVVIPFACDKEHHQRLNDFTTKATTEGKEYLRKKIKHLCPSRESMTYHSDPLSDFYFNSRVDDGYITYMFFMTDGENEEKPDKFKPLLNQWESRYGQKDVYGFYVMLHGKASNDSVESIISKSKHLWKVQTANVNINLIRFTSNVNFFTRDDKYVEVPILGNTEGVEFNITGNSEHYFLSNYTISDNNVLFYVSHHDELWNIPERERLQICISKTKSGDFDFLLTDTISIMCINKKIRTCSPTFNRRKRNIERLGKVLYYPSFCWNESKTIDLVDTLYLNFNKDALSTPKVSADLIFLGSNGKSIPSDELEIYSDDNLLMENKIKVPSSHEKVAIKFRYLPKAKIGKHQGYIKIQGDNLDILPEDIKWQVYYVHKMNPLAKVLMWIGILFLTCLLVWFTIIKPSKFPKFGGIARDLSINGNHRRIVFKGYRQVTLCNQKQNQSLLNKLFCGKILYVESKEITDDIIFLPYMQGRKNAGAIITINNANRLNYIISPNPMPKNGKTQIINTKNELSINL